MALAELVFSERWDVNRRLAELGVCEEDLLYAVERGFSAWAACTKNHPPGMPGYVGWGETVCALRERLILSGWERIDEQNYSLVVNSKGTIALCVATGNEDTGCKGRNPVTACPKGPRTVSAVIANQNQLVFPEMLPPVELPDVSGRETWLLLMHRDAGARELRCELSRPIRLDAERRVDGWAERILLTPRSFDGIDEVREDGGSGSQSPEITVEIKRRA